MASAIIRRINDIASIVALLAIAFATILVDFGTNQKLPEASAATERQLNSEMARERLTCERWGMQEGSEKYAACLADLTEIRVKHDRRRAEGPGNRRDGLITIF